MRYTPTGQPVTNFSLATSYRFTGSDGQQVDETTWFRVSVWGRQAETANQYLKKGSRVLVEGRLVPDRATGNPRIWTRPDGTPAASFEITASGFRFMSSRQEDDAYQSSSPLENQDEDEIPF
jgi:single-strand DNA-binding protein